MVESSSKHVRFWVAQGRRQEVPWRSCLKIRHLALPAGIGHHLKLAMASWIALPNFFLQKGNEKQSTTFSVLIKNLNVRHCNLPNILYWLIRISSLPKVAIYAGRLCPCRLLRLGFLCLSSLPACMKEIFLTLLQVVFNATRGSDYTGDIAIDDVSVKPGFCRSGK